MDSHIKRGDNAFSNYMPILTDINFMGKTSKRLANQNQNDGKKNTRVTSTVRSDDQNSIGNGSHYPSLTQFIHASPYEQRGRNNFYSRVN